MPIFGYFENHIPIAEFRFNDEFPSKLYQGKKKSRTLFNIFFPWCNLEVLFTPRRIGAIFQDQNPIEESGTVDVRYKLAGPYSGIWRIIFRFRIAESRFNDEFPSKLYQEKKKSRNLFNIFLPWCNLEVLFTPRRIGALFQDQNPIEESGTVDVRYK